MSSLIKDEYGNLILEYTPTGDVNLDMLVELWLDGPFPVQNGTKWECGKTLDIVEIQSIVSQTQNKFKEEKIELHVDEELLNDIETELTKGVADSNFDGYTEYAAIVGMWREDNDRAASISSDGYDSDTEHPARPLILNMRQIP